MLIQPAQQQAAQVVNFANSTTPGGVEQEVVRADIPPIVETEKDARAQNELFSTVETSVAPEQQQENTQAQESETPTENGSSQEQASGSDRESADPSALTEEDQALIQQLRARDREVRVHEAAHAAVGGRYAGNASFQYSRGPDGKNYAIGGEVSISTSEVAGDPEATIEKAQTIQAAALAPAQPSTQDRRVAAKAAQLELQARAELQTLNAEQAEREKQARAEQAEEARAKREAEQAAEEPEPVEEESPGPITFSVVQSTQEAESSDEEDSASSDEVKSERPNAREELEKILLGSTSLIQQANQQGLVDPQNPYGKSGFLDILV